MAYCFEGGRLYRAKDGRDLFVMSGCRDEVDVWARLSVGRIERVGTMTPCDLAGLLVSPPGEVA